MFHANIGSNAKASFVTGAARNIVVRVVFDGAAVGDVLASHPRPVYVHPRRYSLQYAPFKASAAQLGITTIQNPLLADLILENYQWKQFILDSLKGGELPLWNPNLFAGVPFLAAGQHSALYPLSIIYYLLPLEKAYGWFTVINLGLAGVFMFGFMRTLGLGRASSVFAGIVYQLSGMMLAQVVFQMIIAAAAWLPLILTMCERIIQQSPALGSSSLVPALGAHRRGRHCLPYSGRACGDGGLHRHHRRAVFGLAHRHGHRLSLPQSRWPVYS